MMGDFYQTVFPDVEFNLEGETQVCCPFPHTASDGQEYYETNPSAGINLEKGTFHCFVCGAGLSEIGFIAQYMNISYSQANRIKYLLDSSNETVADWYPAQLQLTTNVHMIEQLTNELGIAEHVIHELQLGFEGRGIAFPVFLFGKLIDVRTYRPNQHPKYLSRAGADMGMIIPYDLWKEDDRSTLIVAGEKDLAIARSERFNAISITGGEGVIPELFLKDFTGRKVYIIYDNDTTGRAGALRVAMAIKPYAELIKIIDLSDVCVEKGGDLHDFFRKYGKTRDDLKDKIKNTPVFTEEDYQLAKEVEYPTVSLIDGASPQYVGKVVRSNIQVIATFENQFLLPSSISAYKIPVVEDEPKPAENKMRPGETRHWYLDDTNIKDMLYLIDSNLKESQIQGHIRSLLGISSRESNVAIKQESKETVYKCAVTDSFDRIDTEVKQTEFLAYCMNEKLETGKKYKITYKLVPHPFDGQKLIMVILDKEDANDSVNNFKLNEEKIELLKQFQVGDAPLETKINELVERVKGITNYNYNDDLIKFIDFWYHSVLKFSIGRFKDERGYLDAILVGESRTGKSDTTKKLNDMYELGSIVSLAGASATIAGLVGGSNKVNGSYQTRAGLIPQNHMSAVIFEELAKCNGNIVKELTDIRSSNQVRITRVNGSISLPAYVRMLTLTNPRTVGGTPKPITSYPNGIAVISDLIGTAEDIARYDMIAVFPDKGNTEMDPLWVPLEPLSKEAYKTRIRWVWSRSSDQIIISNDIFRYIVEQANELNKEFDSYIKIFGTEAWKKIVRLSTAIAGYVVSTNESFEHIVVQKDHVDYAINYLRSLYDNDTFRFKQFVEEEKRLREFNEDDKAVLQDMFIKNPTILLHLEGCSETTRNTLQAIAGLNSDEFSTFMNQLTRYLFIQFSGHAILPTERFRKGMAQINRNVSVARMGAIRIDGFTN